MSNLPFGFQPEERPDEEPTSGAGSGAGGSGGGALPPGFGQGGPNPLGGAGGFNVGDIGAALTQLGSMLQQMQQGGGTGAAVNWDAATDVARKVIAGEGDPVVGDAQRRGVEEAVRLAELWLDPATAFPSTGAGARAWSRSEWLMATMPAWQRIITPIAEQVQASMDGMMPNPEDLARGLPEELRSMLPADMPVDLGAMLGPLMGMAKQMGANMFAMQAGQGLAALAGEVLGAGDVGLPLTDDGVPTLVPMNVAAFATGLEVPAGEIEVYLALREVAHQRLFTHVSWLGPTVRGAVEEYARGIGLDSGRMEEALRDIDMSNPANIQEALSSGVLAPQDTPEQQAALARLETLLALVEGWVDHVVAAAVGDRLPSSGRLQEAVRRRRAAGGPAEKTFQTLVGLELRPRRLREAAALWSELERVRGVEGRDAVWAHPDLLPGPEDLDDPARFVSGSAISDADLAALTSGEPSGVVDPQAPSGAGDADPAGSSEAAEALGADDGDERGAGSAAPDAAPTEAPDEEAPGAGPA
ncbi:MAG: zinc-dependent metalloprotease [Candidatus Nanopelagicales bacterium]|jgi:putative hydrolase|nr:zinc-dependent metalloprotease [Candidatus Nanopelagicales bacterium]